jgi:hypothetical protein
MARTRFGCGLSLAPVGLRAVGIVPQRRRPASLGTPGLPSGTWHRRLPSGTCRRDRHHDGSPLNADHLWLVARRASRRQSDRRQAGVKPTRWPRLIGTLSPKRENRSWYAGVERRIQTAPGAPLADVRSRRWCLRVTGCGRVAKRFRFARARRGTQLATAHSVARKVARCSNPAPGGKDPKQGGMALSFLSGGRTGFPGPFPPVPAHEKSEPALLWKCRRDGADPSRSVTFGGSGLSKPFPHDP